jgi:hypothetical protein
VAYHTHQLAEIFRQRDAESLKPHCLFQPAIDFSESKQHRPKFSAQPFFICLASCRSRFSYVRVFLRSVVLQRLLACSSRSSSSIILHTVTVSAFYRHSHSIYRPLEEKRVASYRIFLGTRRPTVTFGEGVVVVFLPWAAASRRASSLSYPTYPIQSRWPPAPGSCRSARARVRACLTTVARVFLTHRQKYCRLPSCILKKKLEIE